MHRENDILIYLLTGEMVASTCADGECRGAASLGDGRRQPKDEDGLLSNPDDRGEVEREEKGGGKQKIAKMRGKKSDERFKERPRDYKLYEYTESKGEEEEEKRVVDGIFFVGVGVGRVGRDDGGRGRGRRGRAKEGEVEEEDKKV